MATLEMVQISKRNYKSVLLLNQDVHTVRSGGIQNTREFVYDIQLGTQLQSENKNTNIFFDIC